MFAVDDFIWRAIAAGIGVAVVAGVIGCFVVWRRMAYFGDSLSHSALLGIAMGLLLGVNVNFGIIAVCFLFAGLLLFLQQKKVLATDTLLGIFAHSALSVGIVAISVLQQRVDFYSYLFGDILTVTLPEIWFIYGGGIVILALLVMNWQALVLSTIHEGIARAEGVKTVAVNMLLVFMMTIIVAIAIRIVGILLITSLLIIPAATARQFSRSPEMMAVMSVIFAVFSVIFGISGSVAFDTPSGASIVVAAAATFTLIFPLSRLIGR